MLAPYFILPPRTPHISTPSSSPKRSRWSSSSWPYVWFGLLGSYLNCLDAPWTRRVRSVIRLPGYLFVCHVAPSLKASCLNQARPLLMPHSTLFLPFRPVGLHRSRVLSRPEPIEVFCVNSGSRCCLLEQQCPSLGLNSAGLCFGFLSLLLSLIADVMCLCMAHLSASVCIWQDMRDQ